MERCINFFSGVDSSYKVQALDILWRIGSTFDLGIEYFLSKLAIILSNENSFLPLFIVLL